MSYLDSDPEKSMSVMAHRRGGSRSERVVSGQDLPEVVPWHNAPARKPSERASHAYPQVLAVDTTPVGEKLESRWSRFSIASTHAPPFRSPTSPTLSRKSSFVPKKKKHWVLLVIVIVVIALAIGIAAAVAVSLTQKSHKNAQTNKASNGSPGAAGDQTPSTVVVSQAGPTATGTSSGSSSSSSACPVYVGPSIGELPSSFPGTVASQPPNTINVDIAFTSKLSWPLVSANQTQMQSIQQLVPQAFAFALQIPSDQIQMGPLIGNDTAATKCYIQTVAQVYAPNQYQSTLISYAFNWSSPLFHSPNADVYTLMSRMDNATFPGIMI